MPVVRLLGECRAGHVLLVRGCAARHSAADGARDGAGNSTHTHTHAHSHAHARACTRTRTRMHTHAHARARALNAQDGFGSKRHIGMSIENTCGLLTLRHPKVLRIAAAAVNCIAIRAIRGIRVREIIESACGLDCSRLRHPEATTARAIAAAGLWAPLVRAVPTSHIASRCATSHAASLACQMGRAACCVLTRA